MDKDPKAESAFWVPHSETTKRGVKGGKGGGGGGGVLRTNHEN